MKSINKPYNNKIYQLLFNTLVQGAASAICLRQQSQFEKVNKNVIVYFLLFVLQM